MNLYLKNLNSNNVEGFVKYRRIEENVDEYYIQDFLDDLIKDGWEIIFYSEKEKLDSSFDKLVKYIPVILIVGKRRKLL